MSHLIDLFTDKRPYWIRFKEHYGMPRGHEHDLIYSPSIYARFSDQFFFKFSLKKIVMGKKDRCAVFGCNNDCFFPWNIQWHSLFARKARVNTEWVPSGHPIILLKSNKFSMAAILVKRFIIFAFLSSNIFRTSSHHYKE